MQLSELSLWKLLLSFWLITKSIKTEDTGIAADNYRGKRQINALPLVFPYGGVFKFIFDMSVPVQTVDGISMSFTVNFQFQYVLFTNITQLSQYYFIKTVSREQREIELESRKDERLFLYRAFANMLESKGLNGYECVLRAICEAAQYPVEEEGLFGELIHIMLTPDYGHSPFVFEDPDWTEAMSEFKDAAIAGRQMFSCPDIYTGCAEGQGIMELVSILRDE